MIYLLDTSALLAHHRQEPGWEQVQAIFTEDGAEVVIASVTLTEFARRMRELGASETEIRTILADYQMLFSAVVPVDGAVAWAAFELGCRTPERLPLVDALIAAAARLRGACLVHRDEHMAAIPAERVQQLYLPR
ncbi:MAG: PIN domain-containing protein [Candidatus Competibacter sp.]